ncbi:hypothetical protein N7522_008947 [Penicillium canescens]|uniref:Uncharacterized protein n=1 Tax=Penicillium canescens TaxID=5083 RepID=A0AAD6NAE7_PENCN|nr:uncharacterized protein N7446_002097 [Penicillium canescens]KAJ5997287.1 hypothetical protein N7522_008947 [Penicillium canescens]KAJ6043900.1 hypothetical protein N7460_005255 [Penicillium canescens]KAJ6055372.1 hypothetical protein N7444_004470 [Penicillium canescens]KAJ6074320.1 hypothetical protein N7446_002097 [Penicillium canescens]
MKFSLMLSATALALANRASAFYGQMAASDYSANEGGTFQIIYLTDYNTGSTYSGTLRGGFNGCTSSQCPVSFYETSPGGYGFNALMWRTNDGCHNINFEGALSAGHGWCCGSLPCDFTA